MTSVDEKKRALEKRKQKNQKKSEKEFSAKIPPEAKVILKLIV